MAKKQTVLAAIMDMESDLRRISRLFEALRIIADTGVIAEGGLDREACESLEEIAIYGRQIALSHVTAWEEAFELAKAQKTEDANV